MCKYKVISFDFRSLSHNLMPIFIDDCCELVVVYELLLVVSGLLLLLLSVWLLAFLTELPVYIYIQLIIPNGLAKNRKLFRNR